MGLDKQKLYDKYLGSCTLLMYKFHNNYVHLELSVYFFCLLPKPSP